MARYASGCQTMTISTEGLGSEETLTRALYVNLGSSGRLARLHKDLHDNVSLPSDYQLDPHLSLLYQDVSFPVREKLTQEIKFVAQELRFDELWAVAIPAALKTADDLEGWQMLLACRLASAEVGGSM